MAQPMTLPENPTAEQFNKAEPIIVQAIIEEYYRDGITPLTRVEGDPNTNEFQRTAPGEYKGVFSSADGKTQFAFEINKSDINYSPLNPETIDAMESEGDEVSFSEAIADVTMETRLGVFHRRGVDGLAEFYEWLDESDDEG